MAVLRALRGGNPGQCFPLEGNTAILGRHPDCDIVLESGSVSRQHARVVLADGGYYVEDLRSRNGTYVNGRMVTSRQLLTEEDELRICDLVFVFQHHPPGFRPSPDERTPDGSSTVAMVVDDRQAGVSSSTIMSKVDVSSGSTGLQLEVNTAAKLRALVEIGRSLGKALELNEVLPKLLDSLFSVFVQADRGFIVLQDPGTRRLVPKAVKYRKMDDKETIRISRTIVNTVMQSKEAILSADAASDSRFNASDSLVDFKIRSMMCAPLVGSDGVALGIIQIDTLDQRNRFEQEDLDVLANVAYQAAIALENAQLHETALREQALARELDLAHEVQRGLLPAGPPQVDHYDFFEFYEPANQLGGDYFDYVHLPNGRVAVVVADVSGKGISASLLMARLTADTRYFLASEPSPAEAMSRLNRVFCGAGWEDRFVTLVACVLDPLRHEVVIVNAGHLPPLLRRRTGAVNAVAEKETRLPLGIDEKTQYPEAVISLMPGDSVTLYTDGITEAMNKEDQLYGFQRLWNQLESDAEEVDVIGENILKSVKKFVGTRSQADDMCLTCFGRRVPTEKGSRRVEDRGKGKEEKGKKEVAVKGIAQPPVRSKEKEKDKGE